MLRLAILCYAAIQFAVAVVLVAVAHLALPGALYLGANAVVIVAALLFERQRYRPALDRSAPGTWEPTGERFVDAASGQLMEVRYNPSTGQRDYVPVAQDRSHG